MPYIYPARTSCRAHGMKAAFLQHIRDAPCNEVNIDEAEGVSMNICLCAF